MARILRLQADYNCYSIWSDEEADYIEPVELGLSPDLGAAVEAWEQRCNQTYSTNSAEIGFRSEEERQRFHADGRRLAEAIEAELQTQGYEVRYEEGI